MAVEKKENSCLLAVSARGTFFTKPQKHQTRQTWASVAHHLFPWKTLERFTEVSRSRSASQEIGGLSRNTPGHLTATHQILADCWMV